MQVEPNEDEIPESGGDGTSDSTIGYFLFSNYSYGQNFSVEHSMLLRCSYLAFPGRWVVVADYLDLFRLIAVQKNNQVHRKYGRALSTAQAAAIHMLGCFWISGKMSWLRF